MKFRITRASDWDNKQPVEGAVKEHHHWFIEIKSLEELVSFTYQYGACIVEQADSSDLPRITIYDSYME